MCIKRCAHLNPSECQKTFSGTLGWLFFAALFFIVVAAAGGLFKSACAAENIVISVSLNGEAKGEFFLVRTDDGGFLMREEDLTAIGLKAAPPDVMLIQGERYVPLRSLKDITSAFDEKKLTLALTAAPALLPKTAVDLSPAQQKNVYYPRDVSAFFNYGLSYSAGDPYGFQYFTATDKLGIHAGDYLFLTDSLYTKTDDTGRFIRLQSNLTYERREDFQRLVMGDMFASSGDLGSTINIGGIGFSKVYQIDPYFIKQPTLNLAGSASLPSQADIYLDGVLVDREKILPGQFELKNFSYYGGAHTVEVLLRDPFGNERRILYPVYFSDALLKQGLHEYSYNLGFLREQYGIESDRYGKLAFSAYHRYGLTDSVNIGARAEAADGIYNAGAQVAFMIPQAGIFTAGLAESSWNGTTGSAGSFTYGYQNGSMSASAFVKSYSENYTTIGNASVAPKSRLEAGAGAGYASAKQGAVSINYTLLEQFAAPSRQVTALTYSRNLTRAFTVSTTARTITGNGSDYEFFISLNYYPGKDTVASLRSQRTRDTDTETVQLQKNTPTGEGIGYRAALQQSDSSGASSTSFSPFIQYNGGYAVYTADSVFQRVNGGYSDLYTVSVSGSLVYAGGMFGLSRPVNDSFGIIAIDGLRDVAVRVNSEEMGRTDASGKMVIPTLKSYYHNQISLDPKDVPIDYRLSDVALAVSPSQWTGACVAFEAEKIQAVVGKLAARAGAQKQPLEFYEVTMKVGEQEIKFPTGKGGEFYFETVLPANGKTGQAAQHGCRPLGKETAPGKKIIKPGTYPAWVEFQGQKCKFQLVVPDAKDVMLDIGEVLCEAPATSNASPRESENACEMPELPAAGTVSSPSSSAPSPAPPREGFIFVAQPLSLKGLPASADAATFAYIFQLLRNDPDLRVEIEGHTDRKGTVETNKRLGLKRARAVQKYLVKSGVHESRIVEVSGLGKERPICREKIKACDDINRRIIIRLDPAAHEGSFESEETAMIFTIPPLPRKGSLPAATRKILSQILWYLSDDDELRIELAGHTDRKGSDESNMKVGMERALAVKNYLVKAGVKEDRFVSVISYGKTHLICTKATRECDRLNRRVVIRLVPEV